MKIAIFGAGAYGTALGDVLTSNGHQIDFYDPIVYPGKDLTEVANNSEINILALPSINAPKLLLFMPHDKPLICASKGFISLASFIPFGVNFSVISGGSFAADLTDKKETTLTATSDLTESLFKTSWLSFDRTEDKLGVLICGSLKNIYAIGAGFWGLKYGTHDFDDYINSALSEMQTILAANSCSTATVNLSCGINDLVLTCASEGSRNFDFGTKLKADLMFGKKVISGEAKAPTTEGLYTILAINNTPSFVRPPKLAILDRIISAVTDTPIPTPPELNSSLLLSSITHYHYFFQCFG